MEKIAMGNLPKGWVAVKLVDFVYLVPTGVPKFLGERKYYSTGSINGKSHIPESECSYDKRPSRANRISKIGDVFQARMQGTDKALVINDAMANQLFSTGFLQFRPIANTYDSRLLYYFVKSDYFLKQRDELATGSTQIALTDTNAINLKLIVPPLNEQRRIVAKLGKLLNRVDSCRDRLDKIPTILKRFRQSVLSAACSGRLTADWREENRDVESAKILLEKIKNYRLASAQTKNERNKTIKFYDEGEKRLKQKNNNVDLPATWEFCEINNLGDVCNGSTPSRKKTEYWSGNISWVSSGEVCNNVITKTRETITKEGYKNASLRLLPIGTVLLAMIGEGKTRGQTAILNVESAINQNIAAIIIDHGLISSKYLWYWFQLQYEITRQVGSGSGPQALNCQRVRELPFYLPPLPEQHEIVRRVETLFKKADEIEVRYKKAKAFVEKLTQSILAKAFRGELVPQDPNDEPALVLLDKIKAERLKQMSKKQGNVKINPDRKLTRGIKPRVRKNWNNPVVSNRVFSNGIKRSKKNEKNL